jgi:hypothetical protein
MKEYLSEESAMAVHRHIIMRCAYSSERGRRALGAVRMKIVSHCREQARWVYNGDHF